MCRCQWQYARFAPHLITAKLLKITIQSLISVLIFRETKSAEAEHEGVAKSGRRASLPRIAGFSVEPLAFTVGQDWVWCKPPKQLRKSSLTINEIIRHCEHDARVIKSASWKQHMGWTKSYRESSQLLRSPVRYTFVGRTTLVQLAGCMP